MLIGQAQASTNGRGSLSTEASRSKQAPKVRGALKRMGNAGSNLPKVPEDGCLRHPSGGHKMASIESIFSDDEDVPDDGPASIPQARAQQPQPELSSGSSGTLHAVAETVQSLKSSVFALQERLDTQAYTSQQILTRTLDGLTEQAVHKKMLQELLEQQRPSNGNFGRALKPDREHGEREHRDLSASPAHPERKETVIRSMWQDAEAVEHEDAAHPLQSSDADLGNEPSSPSSLQRPSCTCGNVFLDDARFCRKCGNPRPGVCDCGNILASDALFCRKCGKPREEEKSPERRLSAISKGFESVHFDHITEFKVHMMKQKTQRTGAFEDVNDCHERFIAIAESRAFEFASAVVIISHSIFIGVYVEYLSTVSMEGHAAFSIINIVLTLCFLFEVIIKAMAERKEYIKGPEKGWNVFDLTLLSLVLLEVLLRSVVSGEAKKKAKKVLKIAEMVRTARVLRIFRFLKFSGTLSVIITQILSSMSSLGWILVMSSMMIFSMSVCITTGSLYILHPEGDDATVTMTSDLHDVNRYFGSVHASLYTTFAAMGGGYLWADIVAIMQEMGWVYQAMFVLYMAFFTIAMLNIITGIFVDNALKADDELASTRECRKEQLRSLQLREVFESLDVDQKGTISMDEFVDMKNDEDMVFCMSELKIPNFNASSLFRLLDTNGNGELDVHEFVSGLLHLKGQSTSLDVKTLMYESRQLKHMLMEVATIHRNCFDDVSSRLSVLEARMADAGQSGAGFRRCEEPRSPADPRLPPAKSKGVPTLSSPSCCKANASEKNTWKWPARGEDPESLEPLVVLEPGSVLGSSGWPQRPLGYSLPDDSGFDEDPAQGSELAEIYRDVSQGIRSIFNECPEPSAEESPIPGDVKSKKRGTSKTKVHQGGSLTKPGAESAP